MFRMHKWIRMLYKVSSFLHTHFCTSEYDNASFNAPKPFLSIPLDFCQSTVSLTNRAGRHATKVVWITEQHLIPVDFLCSSLSELSEAVRRVDGTLQLAEDSHLETRRVNMQRCYNATLDALFHIHMRFPIISHFHWSCCGKMCLLWWG